MVGWHVDVRMGRLRMLLDVHAYPWGYFCFAWLVDIKSLVLIDGTNTRN